MNDRIQELKKEAFSQTEWEELDYDRILEKLAELIVRECAGIAQTAEPYQSSDLIKKHFGIEV
jgi:hypothetical protein